MLPTLRTAREKIMIQGHVGPDELGHGYFEREHYLAYNRALTVKEFLMEQEGFQEEFFQIGVADSGSTPNRAILPVGMDPRQAGASAAVYLINETHRH